MNPFRSDKGEFKISFHKAIQKATDTGPGAPKTKHIRRIVLETFSQHSGSCVWAELHRRPWSSKLVSWKCVNTIHRVLLEGHHSVLEDTEGAKPFLRNLSRVWKAEQEVGVVKALSCYIDYLLYKLEFHSALAEKKETARLFTGNFSLDDFVRNQPAYSSPSQKFQSYTVYLSSLLDLQEHLIKFESLVLDESKIPGIDPCIIWSLIPLIPESYGIYTIITYLLKFVINQSDLLDSDNASSKFKSEEDLFEYFTSTYYSQYINLRDFYFKASNIHAISSVIPIPNLPSDPPQFVSVRSDRKQLKKSRDRRRQDKAKALSIEIQSPSAFHTQLANMNQPATVDPMIVFSPFANPNPVQNLSSNPIPDFFNNPGFNSNPLMSNLFSNNVQAPAPTPQPTSTAHTGWVTFGKPAVQTQPAVQIQPPFVPPVQQVPVAAAPFDAGMSGEMAAMKARLAQVEAANAALMTENAQLKARLSDLEILLRGASDDSVRAMQDLTRASAEIVSLRSEIDESRRKRLQSEIDAGVASLESALIGLGSVDSGSSGPGDLSSLLGSSRSLVEALSRLMESSSAMGGTEEEKEQRFRDGVRRVFAEATGLMGTSKNVAAGLDVTDGSREVVLGAVRRGGREVVELMEVIGRSIDEDDDWRRGVEQALRSHGAKVTRDVESEVGGAVRRLEDRERERAAREEREKASGAVAAPEPVSKAAEELETQASAELLAAARVIEAAARSLVEARERQRLQQQAERDKAAAAGTEYKEGDGALAEPIMNAAGSIAEAAAMLIRAATEAQKERELAGIASRNGGDGGVYKSDPAWTEGLISAAKQVALATQQLVEAANEVATKGKDADMAKLIAASKGVAAATALLVSAFKAKASLNSKSAAQLTEAAGAVRRASNALVDAARKAAEDSYEANARRSSDAQNDRKMSATEYQVALLNQRAKIEKMQKKLENGLVELSKLKQNEYDGASAGGASGNVGGVAKPVQSVRSADESAGLKAVAEQKQSTIASLDALFGAINNPKAVEKEQARLNRHGV